MFKLFVFITLVCLTLINALGKNEIESIRKELNDGKLILFIYSQSVSSVFQTLFSSTLVLTDWFYERLRSTERLHKQYIFRSNKIPAKIWNFLKLIS